MFSFQLRCIPMFTNIAGQIQSNSYHSTVCIPELQVHSTSSLSGFASFPSHTFNLPSPHPVSIHPPPPSLVPIPLIPSPYASVYPFSLPRRPQCSKKGTSSARLSLLTRDPNPTSTCVRVCVRAGKTFQPVECSTPFRGVLVG